MRGVVHRVPSARRAATLGRPRRDGRVLPRLLTIAGSDSGGASGLQADLRAFAALGCYGMTVVTAVTAQNTRGIAALHPLAPPLVVAQLEAVLDDIGADAVKTGMLWSGAVARAVARTLSGRGLALVVDPVLRASTGQALATKGLLPALRERLLPLAALVTPNLLEAEALVGHRVRSRRDRERAAGALLDLGPRAVLLKGGHGARDRGLDLLAWRDDGRLRLRWLRAPILRTRNMRGTGCVLAAACAAFLARGLPLPLAVGRAKAFLTAAIAAGARRRLGRGPGPVEPALHTGFRLSAGYELTR